jgi:preprotein translocase subunit SecE
VSQTRSDAEDLDGASAEVEPQDEAERKAAGKADAKTRDKARDKGGDRRSSTKGAPRAAKKKSTAPRKRRTSPFLLYRQIIAELRKVVTPTRTELMTYTSVVIVFVLCVIAFVALFDAGIGRLVTAVFG